MFIFILVRQTPYSQTLAVIFLKTGNGISIDNFDCIDLDVVCLWDIFVDKSQ
jgi:hypothetical protein